MLYGFPWPKTDPDPRKLLARVGEGPRGKGRPKAREDRLDSKYTAYRRQGRCGKGTWVEGGGDEEERVMDHRTIHRFVLPEEEKELTRKGLLVEAEQARAMGEDDLAALVALDGKGKRRLASEARSSEGLQREDTEDSMLWEDSDIRRRSNRIVESRVYVNVCMKR